MRAEYTDVGTNDCDLQLVHVSTSVGEFTNDNYDTVVSLLSDFVSEVLVKYPMFHGNEVEMTIGDIRISLKQQEAVVD